MPAMESAPAAKVLVDWAWAIAALEVDPPTDADSYARDEET